MMIGLVIAGILALTIIAIFGIGRMLPKEHRARADAIVGCNPEQVWKLVADPGQATQWRSDLASVQEVPPDVVRETPKKGRALEFQTTYSNPPNVLVRRIVDTGLPFGGQWKITIEPENGQSRISIIEEGFVKPALFRFVSRFVVGQDRTIKHFLQDLKTYCDKKAAAPPEQTRKG
jgi:Polyketide cyclase / dehydrase and lipid transport